MAFLKKVVKQFGNTDILNFPTSSPIVIKAGEAGKIIVPIYVTFAFNPWVANYTNIDGTTHTINVDTTTNDWWNGSKLNSNTILAPGQAMFQYVGTASGGFLGVLENNSNVNTNLVGTPINLLVANGVSGAFTGGDPSQKLIVSFYYIIVKATN